MKKYINNKKYISCDELSRIFTTDYGVKVKMEDIHRLVDPYCRKRKGSMLQIDGEWFYDTATIYHLRCYGDNAVEFVKKIKALAPKQEKQTEDDLEYNPNFNMDSVEKWYRPSKHLKESNDNLIENIIRKKLISELKMKNVSKITKIVENTINNFLLKEINFIAKSSPITICSLEDFKEICASQLCIDDNNVESLDGKYAFIEIGSTIDRCIFDFEYSDSDSEWGSGENFYNNGQFYFKSEHSNVLKLEFDDNIKINDNGKTPVRLSKKEVSKKYWNDKWSDSYRPTFRYENAKGFDYEMASRTDDFIEKNIQKNPNIKFIIHCRQGRSRSAAMGYYLAKRLQIDIEKYFQEYNIENKDGSLSNQFNIYQTSDTKGKHMNHRVSSIMFDLSKNRDEYYKNPSLFNYGERKGANGKEHKDIDIFSSKNKIQKRK